MEGIKAPDFDIELAAQRENVAAFIQNRLQPVGQILTEPDEEAEFEVRDYQLDAWQALWEAREQGEMSALVTLATGLGKTSVGVFDVIKFREEMREQEGRDPKVLFVCHQDRILEQAAKRFNRFAPDLSQGYYTGVQKDEDKDITFGTFQSLEKNIDKFDPFEYDYIIYDEAHHAQADKWHRVVKHFNPTFQLALTATPDRMDGLEIKDLFGREVYAKGLGEALAEGLLADIDYHIVFDDAVKEALDAGFHPKNLREMRELLEVPRRNNVIARNIQEKMEEIGAEDAKTIVFCSDIAHTQVMAKLLGGKAYHSEMKRSERDEVLDNFRDGDLQIICARDMFNEGIDIPEANLLVFLRSTQSKTVFEQQLGRGLRKQKGKEQVSVLDFVGNVKRLQEILDLSNAISALASESELDQIVSDGDRPREGGKLNVSTSHASFDFDTLAVDILNTYQSLIFEQAPEGYVSVDAFARELGTTYSTLKQLIAHHQVETGRYKFHSTVGTGLSPDSQEYIRGLGGFVDAAPEGYLSAHIFAKEFGTTAPSLMKALKGYKIPVGRHRFGTNSAISFSPEAQQMVRETVTFVGPAPEDYVSVQALADELGISHRYLTRAIEENGIKTGKHRFGVPTGISLSPESQAQVRALGLEGESMPEDYVSVSAFTQELKTTYKVLVRRLEELGVEPGRYKLGNGFTSGLSPEDQEKIRTTFYPSIPEAPEGYVSINTMRTSLGIGKTALLRVMQEYGIESEELKFRGRRGEGLSPETQKRLGELISVAPPAPEGTVSVTAYAKKGGIALPTLLKLIDEHGIETGRHRFRTQAVASLSSEAQTQISEIRAQGVPVAPEGYMSVPAFAKTLGMAPATIFKFAEEHGIETGEHVFGINKVGASLSPEAQEQINAVRAEGIPPAPEGYKSVTALAKELDSHWSLLTKLIKDHDVEAATYQFRTPGVGLSPTAQQQLSRLVQEYEVPDAPEDYQTVKEFAKEQGIGRARLNRIMGENEVEAAPYKFSGTRVPGLSPTQQAQLKNLVDQAPTPPPEGYVSLGAFAQELNAARPTIEKLIQEYGVETSRHFFKTATTTSLSPEAQQRIRELRARE
jgi:superfamily II DNA or RNA helicase/biotin operon repressor